MEDEITSRAGLSVYSEFLRGFGIKDLIDRHMPLPKEYRTKTIQTLRWSLIGIAGKVVSLVGDLCFCLQLHGTNTIL